MKRFSNKSKYILISLLFFVATVVAGYYTYYFMKVYTASDWYIWSIVFASAAVIALILSLFFVFRYSHFSITEENKKFRNKAKKWEDISHHVGEAGDDAFNNLPIGIITYDSEYKIIWKNPGAVDIFETNLIDTSLEVLSKQLYQMVVDEQTSMLFVYGDNKYEVVHRPGFTTLYFFDVTERENIKKRYDNRITGIGLIEISNLEDSLKKFDMQTKVNLRGKLMGDISQYFIRHNGYIQNSSDNRMTVVLDKESILQMCEDKFSIFDTINVFKSNNDNLKLSVSMGIACYDNSYHELGIIAQNGLELAERRGGDQAIVNIEGEQIQPFGAKTNTLERNTQVEARINSLSLRDAVEKASNVLIMCHRFADTDALGGALAAYRMIGQTTDNVKIVFDTNLADVTVKKICENFKMQLSNCMISLDDALSSIKEDTLLVIVDTQSPKLVMFTKLYDAIQNKNDHLFVIDHHRPGDEGYENYLVYYQDQGASSSTEMIAEMFMYYKDQNSKNDINEQKIKITPLEASIMLSGIVVDTNNYTMRATQRTFEATSVLYSYGADMLFVKKILQEDIAMEKFLATSITKSEIFEKIFSVVCLEETDKIPDRTALAKISDRQLTVSGIEASFTIGRISEDTVGVSARSLGTTINVQTIMEQMGGGGHFNSSATQRKNVTIEELKKELIQIVKLEYVEGGKGTMKVILTQDVKGKGKKGQVIDVANGYANFLITNKQASVANDENLAKLAEEQAKEKQIAENMRNVFLKLKNEIDGKEITIKIKVGAQGKSFGHVTTKQVCEEFEKQLGMHIDKRKVELPAEINSIGIFTASVKLDLDIVAQFKIKVEEE